MLKSPNFIRDYQVISNIIWRFRQILEALSEFITKIQFVLIVSEIKREFRRQKIEGVHVQCYVFKVIEIG